MRLCALVLALALLACAPKEDPKKDMAQPGLQDWTEEFGAGGP